MQIMPGTATHTVKMFSIPGYSSPNCWIRKRISTWHQLPAIVYQQLGNNRIFSSAAYNAGPGRVQEPGLATAPGVSTLAFVESIPFSETRLWKNVLATLITAYFMGDKPTLMSAGMGRRY